MEIGERFLPIGTIVLLKGGKRELMINSYCIVPGGEAFDKHGKVDVAGEVFDYGGCIYPEGMITSDQLFAFNHGQIEKICYMGYETDNQKKLSEGLNAARKLYEEETAKEKKAEDKEPSKEEKKEEKED